MSARSWTLRIPAPAKWLNANARTDRRRAAGTVATWRDAARFHAAAAKVPALGRCRIRAELHFTDNRRRDDHNYFPTVKALVDGLVDYGLVPDDSRQYLVGVEICGGPPIKAKPYGPPGEVLLTIAEVA